MLVLCDDQIRALHMQLEIAQMGGLRGALAAQKSVKDDAEAFLKEKSSSELVQLKATIESKLKDSASHDTEFMEEVSLLLQSIIATSALMLPLRFTAASLSPSLVRACPSHTATSCCARSISLLLPAPATLSCLVTRTMTMLLLLLLAVAMQRTRQQHGSLSRRGWRKGWALTRRCAADDAVSMLHRRVACIENEWKCVTFCAD